MALNYNTLIRWPLPTVRQSYGVRDSSLYALGIGVSVDPMDERDLAYIYEGPGMVTVPTMATVIGQRAQWMDAPELGIDCQRIVHGEQQVTVLVPLPTAATIVSDERVAAVYDKGPGRGALVQMERSIVDAESGTTYARLKTTYFLRGDGGCGAPSAPPSGTERNIPDRRPDLVKNLPTRSDQAMIYRLSGDINPLHIDRAFAQRAGFDKPILHGLCTYGIVAHAIVAEACDRNPARLQSIDARFSSPVYPGETIQTELWQLDSGTFAFRAKALERNVVVLDRGLASLRP